MRGVMTVTDTAYYLMSTEDAVYALIRDKAIPFHKQGRRVLFVKEELDTWIKGLPGASVKFALQHILRGDTLVDTAPSGQDHRTSLATTMSEPIILTRGPTGPRFKRQA